MAACVGREEACWVQEDGGIDNNQGGDETGEPILFGQDGTPRLDK